LFGIRPDTLLGTLGLENGDRLQTINGFDMASPEKALEAYGVDINLAYLSEASDEVSQQSGRAKIDFIAASFDKRAAKDSIADQGRVIPLKRRPLRNELPKTNQPRP
jgi:hypothetical protein